MKKKSTKVSHKLNKKDHVIILDQDSLEWPMRIKAEKTKIQEETVKTESRDTLLKLRQFEEDRVYRGSDIFSEEDRYAEEDRKNIFEALMMGKKIGVKDTAQKRGKAGGSREKICVPILFALQWFVERNPQYTELSNNRIMQLFLGAISEDNDHRRTNDDDRLDDDRCIEVTFNDMIWRVFCPHDDDLIIAEPEETSRLNHSISIKPDTLRKKYIPKIKKVGK